MASHNFGGYFKGLRVCLDHFRGTFTTAVVELTGWCNFRGTDSTCVSASNFIIINAVFPHFLHANLLSHKSSNVKKFWKRISNFKSSYTRNFKPKILLEFKVSVRQ